MHVLNYYQMENRVWEGKRFIWRSYNTLLESFTETGWLATLLLHSLKHLSRIVHSRLTVR